MQRTNQEKQAQLDQLLSKVKNPQHSQETKIDAAVRTALQKARRNVTLMQKLSNGIYKVKNQPQLVMVDIDASEMECTASYTDEKGKL